MSMINIFRTATLSLLCALLFAQVTSAQDHPTIPDIDRVRLAEAFKIGESLGNQVWDSWDKAPFAVLLVTPDYEFLIRNPRPSDDFTLIGYDSLLQSKVYYRARTFSTNLLATFPAVGGVPTIVIGQAENTLKKTSSPWVITVLHEHFHQLQDSHPDYFRDVDSLDLSGGDKTGMWMLNYPFPYESSKVDSQFVTMTGLLLKALNSEGQSDLDANAGAYLTARGKLGTMLDSADYRYFSFQIWQEGIARYTEYRIAELAGREYTPSAAFRALKDYEPFDQVANGIKTGIITELFGLQLDQSRRVAFYPIGAAEGLLLDRVNPGWHKRYFTEKFYVDRYFNLPQ